MTQPEAVPKLERVRAYLAASGMRGALLASQPNFSWITGGGRGHVSIASERAVAAVLVTADAAYLLADNIERRRLEEEELPGHPFQVREFSWWSSSLLDEARRLVPEAELASDLPGFGHPLSATEGVRLRNPLLPEEMERYRKLGEDVAVALTHAALHCRPGLSEHQLAGMLAGVLMDLGLTPGVTLVAVDERAHTRRHPLPTDRRLERYAMLVVGGRRHGLHLSATRLVHFGPVPEELERRLEACARVDAAMLAASRPGAPLNEVFRTAQQAYAAEGFPEEWQHHHQGGPTGYQARDLKATPTEPEPLQLHQAVAWNPSIAGVKSEDAALITAEGVEVLSRTPDLPEMEAEAAGRQFIRPAILER
jgi:Xaa-Pro aminopeptidase